MDMHSAPPIFLSSEERSVLAAWARAKSIPQRLVQRARIITKAADGVTNQDIAQQLDISRPTVQLWRERFLALRVTGLEKDAPRSDRIPSIPDRKVRAVVEATLHTKPSNATHWSTRTMAKVQGLSQATIRRIWKQHNLKHHLIKTFKLSRDKRFVEKLYDVVGLYLNPPERSLVLCVDEKSQIQVLDRTQPGLPLKSGRCGTMTHDYKRNGTTTLFAALSMLDGKIIGECMPRHRHQEFIRFLKKIDAEIPAELDLHFIPTSSSWPNMVERWFREITDKRIRRGSFASVPELITAIQTYLDGHNQNPHIFTRTASAADILTKVAKCKEALDSLH